MTNDNLADFLTRIRNASTRKSLEVVVPASKMIKAVSEILKTENYIEDVSEVDGNIVIKLKYINKEPAIIHLEKVSKPGLRIYVGYSDIKKVLNGLGISILSTSKGVMTCKKARLEKIGGEFLCKVW